MDIYVGNLSQQTTQQELEAAFAAFGQVAAVRLVTDRYSGQRRGFAFVEMANPAEADAAIAALNGKAINGQALTVNKAKPKTEGGGRGPRY